MTRLRQRLLIVEPICAVRIDMGCSELSGMVTRIPRHSCVVPIAPTNDGNMLRVECNGEHYAVFERDLFERSRPADA